jgi:coenzyme Q-binding protein COQ10
MPSARKSIEMSADPAAVMAVLTDFEAYPSFLPEILAVELIAAEPGRWDVLFRAHVIRPIQYTLRLELVGPQRLAWTLLDGLFTSNEGCWELEALEPGDGGAPRTLATYEIDLVLGVFVPQALVNSLVGESLPATLRRFQERVAAAAGSR